MSVHKIPTDWPTGLAVDPIFSLLREREGVARIHLPYGGDGWLVTRHRDAAFVGADRRFIRSFPMTHATPRVSRVPRQDETLGGLDGDAHMRLRRPLGMAMSYHVRTRVPQIVRRVVHERMAWLRAEGRGADFMEGVAFAMPMHVIAELMGLPMSDRIRLRAWSDALIARDNVSEGVIEASAQELRAYLKTSIEKCAASTDATLLNSLFRARDEASPPLTIEEITTLAFTLVLAGYETTACMLGSSLYLLLAPNKRLEDSPVESIDLAVEECLRYIPLGGGVGRTRIAATDVEVGGVKIERGEAVFICGHAVNRDPRVFEAPENVVLNRRVNPHQTFGNGPHRCLGAPLARLELVAAMGALFESFPRLKLQLEAEAVPWRQGRLMRGPDELRVTW